MRSFAIILLLAVGGCATKQYGIAQPVSPTEAELMDCKDIALELERVAALDQQIDDTGSFDGRTVLGFLGDFGIGNGLAKNKAREASAQREQQLRELKTQKSCP